MAGAAWEAWVLWWLAAFQLAVAYWWWKGPWLDGTRAWGTGAFVLNGVAIMVRGFEELDPGPVLFLVDALADRWSDLFLLGFVVSCWRGLRRSAGRSRPLVVLAGAGLVWASLGLLPPFARDGGSDLPLAYPLQELPLLLAILVTAAALVDWSRRSSDAGVWAYGLVLAVLALHYAELGVHDFLNRALGEGLDIGGPLMFNRVLGVAGAVALAAVLLALFYRLAQGSDRAERRRLALVALFVIGGALVGAARLGVVQDGTLVFASIGAVRPIGFVAAQAALAAPSPLGAGRYRRMAAGAALMAPTIGVLIMATQAWGMGVRGALLLAAATLVIALPACAALVSALERRVAPTRQPDGGVAAASSALDPARVPLPPAWQARLEDSRKAFAGLPAPARRALEALTNWQRILLYLRAIEGRSAPNAYERSTPGLHFATQCPYASIGPEVSRINRRASDILRELAVAGRGAAVPRGPLVSSSWGRVEGLRSGRVKVHRLTPLGAQAADALHAQAGLVGISDQLLAKVLGREVVTTSVPR